MSIKEPMLIKDLRKFLFKHPTEKKDVELWKWAYAWVMKGFIALCVAISSFHWADLARFINAFR